MKEMKSVNRDQKVRELGLEKEGLGGNICLQSQWAGGGRVRKPCIFVLKVEEDYVQTFFFPMKINSRAFKTN